MKSILHMLSLLSILAIAAYALSSSARGAEPEVKIGSKKFTESVIIGDMVADLLQNAGYRAMPRKEVGGTRVLRDALVRGEIDVYP